MHSRPLFVSLLALAASPALALTCTSSTGQHFCLTQKVLTVSANKLDPEKIDVEVHNHNGCEPLYHAQATMSRQDNGTWLSADGKRSLGLNHRFVRWGDQDAKFGDPAEFELSEFYFSRSSCE